MPLTWNEIKTRAAAFVYEWRGETREHAEAKAFWDAFLRVFGVERRRVATFEEAVKKAGGGQGFIDLFWPGVMIAEHKSRGKSLDRAYGQALDYFPNLPDGQFPRYVVVSDFARFRLTDLYGPLAMPPALVAAYRALDAAVDRAYCRAAFRTEAERVSLLFDRYEALANPLAVA